MIAVEGLRDDKDYLLVRYETAGYRVRIQKSTALYILMTPKEGKAVPLDDVSEYVKSSALKVLNIPEKDEEGEPLVGVSTLDIGRSRCGTFTYTASFPPPRHWYSQIGWWSDGQHVLFQTSISQGRLEDMSKFASQPPSTEANLFHYKRSAANR